MGDKPRVLVWEVQPLVLRGLLAGCSDCLDIWIAAGDGGLLEEAIENQVVAVISNRDYVAEVAGSLPEFLVVLGISSESDDVVVCKGEMIMHLNNPSPRSLCSLIGELI